jgi:hypothetical protein
MKNVLPVGLDDIAGRDAPRQGAGTRHVAGRTSRIASRTWPWKPRLSTPRPGSASTPSPARFGVACRPRRLCRSEGFGTPTRPRPRRNSLATAARSGRESGSAALTHWNDRSDSVLRQSKATDDPRKTRAILRYACRLSLVSMVTARDQVKMLRQGAERGDEDPRCHLLADEPAGPALAERPLLQ